MHCLPWWYGSLVLLLLQVSLWKSTISLTTVAALSSNTTQPERGAVSEAFLRGTASKLTCCVFLSNSLLSPPTLWFYQPSVTCLGEVVGWGRGRVGWWRKMGRPLQTKAKDKYGYQRFECLGQLKKSCTSLSVSLWYQDFVPTYIVPCSLIS